MNGSLLALFIVLIFIGFQYLLEVHVGGSTCIYDAESGSSSVDCTPRKSSPGQFLGMAAPLQLAGLGLPLLVHDLCTGALLISLSLLLLFLFRNKHPAKISPVTNEFFHPFRDNKGERHELSTEIKHQ